MADFPTQPGSRQPAMSMSFGPVTMNRHARTVFVHGRYVALSWSEFSFLNCLAVAHGRNVPLEVLSLQVLRRPLSSLEDRAVAQVASGLRRKLRAGGLVENLVQAARGQGYWMQPPDPPAPAAAMPGRVRLGAGYMGANR